MKISTFLIVLLISFQFSCGQKTDQLVTITTKYGDVNIVLYDNTPKHKANFLKLATSGFYDSLTFHRVIREFMIQGGSPDTKNAKPGTMVGRGDVGYTVDAEINPNIFHKKGALAAARDNNPAKASSGCQFYIVHGKIFNEDELNMMEGQLNRTIPKYQRDIYTTLGGAPNLDMAYTVFGEVISGIEIVDKIANEAVDQYDRPNTDIKMSVSVREVKRSKITKLYGYRYL